jgi:hypothetical protein
LSHRLEEVFLLIELEQRRLDATRDCSALLLFCGQDVGGALGSGEQVPAVLGVEKRAEGRDPAGDVEQVIGLPA